MRTAASHAAPARAPINKVASVGTSTRKNDVVDTAPPTEAATNTIRTKRTRRKACANTSKLPQLLQAMTGKTSKKSGAAVQNNRNNGRSEPIVPMERLTQAAATTNVKEEMRSSN